MTAPKIKHQAQLCGDVGGKAVFNTRICLAPQQHKVPCRAMFFKYNNMLEIYLQPSINNRPTSNVEKREMHFIMYYAFPINFLFDIQTCPGTVYAHQKTSVF